MNWTKIFTISLVLAVLLTFVNVLVVPFLLGLLPMLSQWLSPVSQANAVASIVSNLVGLFIVFSVAAWNKTVKQWVQM